jgi:hypothetical protein
MSRKVYWLLVRIESSFLICSYIFLGSQGPSGPTANFGGMFNYIFIYFFESYIVPTGVKTY